MKNKIDGVFFDCWDTLITFNLINQDWNYISIKNHAINADEINWNDVSQFCKQFYHDYYAANLNYELEIKQIVNLIVMTFHIKLNCSLETISHEFLTCLDPKPVKNIEKFIDFLNKEGITYACLSNTIYRKDDTLATLNKVIPNLKLHSLLASCDIGVKKPNPLFFQAGVGELHLDIKNCMYIGNNLFQDVYGSHISGFKYSVYNSWQNDKELQLQHHKNVTYDFSYIEIKDYLELISFMEQL